MIKKIVVLSIILSLTGIATIAEEIGNVVNEKEYPSSELVLPKTKDNQQSIMAKRIQVIIII